MQNATLEVLTEQLMQLPAFGQLPKPDTRPVDVDKLQVNATVRPDTRLRVDTADGESYGLMQAEVYVDGVRTSVDLFGLLPATTFAGIKTPAKFTSAATLRGDTVTVAQFLRAIADKIEGK